MDNIKIIRDIQDIFRYHSLQVCRDIVLGQPSDSRKRVINEYGYSPKTPIEVCGIPGIKMYLNSLFCEESDLAINYKRIKSTSSMNTKFPVDEYFIACKDGSQLNVLYFDYYHPNNSEIAPLGYYLVSQSIE